MDKQEAKAPPAPPAPPAIRIVNAGPAPSRPDPVPVKQPDQVDATPAGPVDLKAVLDPVAPPPGAAPGPITVNAVPIEGIDPDDAEAGRELLSWLRRGIAEFAAKFVYKAKPDDPRLEKLKEENKFLKVALKRNSDKAAPLGWFTRGWVGLAVGFGIEFIRVALTFPPPAPGASPAKPAAPPPGPETAPTAPPVTTVQENVEEAVGRQRLSIEDRLRIFNKGKE
jgi:hypothetical protein